MWCAVRNGPFVFALILRATGHCTKKIWTSCEWKAKRHKQKLPRSCKVWDIDCAKSVLCIVPWWALLLILRIRSNVLPVSGIFLICSSIMHPICMDIISTSFETYCTLATDIWCHCPCCIGVSVGYGTATWHPFQRAPSHTSCSASMSSGAQPKEDLSRAMQELHKLVLEKILF